MYTTRISHYYIDDTKVQVNMYNLDRLADKHLQDYSDKEKREFCNNVSFRISGITFTNDISNYTDIQIGSLKGMSVEEYYFYKCLAYVNKYDLETLLEEDYDENIMNCGMILPDNEVDKVERDE